MSSFRHRPSVTWASFCRTYTRWRRSHLSSGETTLSQSLYDRVSGDGLDGVELLPLGDGERCFSASKDRLLRLFGDRVEIQGARLPGRGELGRDAVHRFEDALPLLVAR